MQGETKIAVMGSDTEATGFHHITKPGKMNIIESGGHISFYNEQIIIDDTLEPGQVYEVNVDPVFLNISLKRAAALQLPDKVYDFEKSFREQVLKALRHPKANNNIGVLLEGYKGQGKSVAAKQLAIESGLPVIMITSPIIKGADINRFLSQIKQDFVLLIDEFEKLFKNDDRNDDRNQEEEKGFHGQNTFLSLLDGTISLEHKRLVILTTNKEIGDKFINRPGRIRYYKKYNFMSQEVFDAILDDKLENQAFRQDLIDNINVPACTIDILTSIIEEVNIQEKPYSSFKDFFNHKERKTTYSRYKKNGASSKFEYFDEIILSKEITQSTETIHQLGYNANILKNTGEEVYYEIEEFEEDPSNPEGGKGTYKKNIYKLVKLEYRSVKMVF